MVDPQRSGERDLTLVYDALRRAWARSDWLFEVVGRDRWLQKGIVLRHPFLFYVGHLPSFAWNHTRRALGLPPHDERLDELFARGIDPATEAEARALSDVAWPRIEAVLAYRDAIRGRIGEQVPAIAAAAAHDEVARDLLPLVLEHELMHHETLLYMIRQRPAEELHRPEPSLHPLPGPAPAPERVVVGAGSVRLGAERGGGTFGWCNEFPSLTVDVPAFRMDRFPITVDQFRRFVDSGGYADPSLFEPGDHEWLTEVGLQQPLGWRGEKGSREVRSLLAWHPLDEVAGWPVQVSLAEARAYCRWTASRLPSEAELHRAAFTTPDGGQRAYPWGDGPLQPEHGAMDFARHGRVAVDANPEARSAWGVDQLVGNGWEWSSTPFLPRPGFEAIHRNYPGYSADFFDGEHFVVFGASWATAARLVRRSFRNWYQARYPYAFTTFRTVAR
ncbi:MAG: SUMF1/EgtB/PvdO family nonheme iron enzyme [Myxococcales bacterium]|nr:SUMF1/EgtB/PvdO family nonheme iron enzyme [Myxococcales bacterium]